MRVLFTCAPALGHFHPLAPLARALSDAHHEVAFATAAELCPWIEEAGFGAFPAGPGLAELLEQAARVLPGFRPAHIFSSDMATAITVWARVGTPARLPDLDAIVRRWRPHVVVHEDREFAGPVVAANAGIPSVAHGLGALLPLDLYRLAADGVAPFRDHVPAPGVGGLFPHLYLDVFPPSLRRPWAAELACVRPVRPVPFDAGAGLALPEWVTSLDPVPTVYMTFGTTFTREPALLEATVAGLREEAWNVIVTVSHHRDPAALGPQPANVHVERYLPQSLLLAHCDVVVCHAGSGTTLATLAHGLPLLAIPQGGDQFINAGLIASSGAGRALGRAEVSPEAVRREVRALLDDASYRNGAARLRQEIDGMPSPGEAVGVIEELVRSAEPGGATSWR